MHPPGPIPAKVFPVTTSLILGSGLHGSKVFKLTVFDL
jgi:hypothetical protein